MVESVLLTYSYSILSCTTFYTCCDYSCDFILAEKPYEMNPEAPGYLLIINNKEFKKYGIEELDKMLTRYGTEKDAESLKKIFGEGGLGFKVVEMTNQTHELTAEVCSYITLHGAQMKNKILVIL